MRDRGPSPSLEYLPKRVRLPGLARAAHDCHACHLWKDATQVVFGEGPSDARLMFVGEEPGDVEDRRGQTFVGPAGHFLMEIFAELGLHRDDVYLTNAVKHFKWKPAPRGKRRLHVKPNATEIHACHGWLEKEIELVAPEVIVCLGAVAAASLLGSSFALMKNRGTVLDDTPWAPHVVATWHPSAIVRMRRDHDLYLDARRLFKADLRGAMRLAVRAKAA